MLERYFTFRLNELPIGSFQQTDICSNSHLPTTNNDGGDVVEEVAVDNDVRDAHKEVVEDSDVPEDSDDDGGDALEEVAEAVEDSGDPEGNDDDVAPVRQLSYPMYQK